METATHITEFDSFTRYLSAKKTVDDRALNKHVWEAMAAALPAATAAKPLRVLEIGAGIGTMVERLAAQNVLTHAHYTAVDTDPANIAAARQRLGTLPASIHLELVTADAFAFAANAHSTRTWDLLIAHAFLDLVDIPAALPQLLPLLAPGGAYYFTINFDGNTILQPTIDAPFDKHIEALYHRTMDERLTNGKPSGDSQTGRHMFHQLRAAGASILAAGSSDWVVFATDNGYPADEAYFLHFIVNTMYGALNGHPELNQERFTRWIAQRHAQIERGELVYIAHQLDFYGRFPTP
ncbi:MAG: class I SAM-dependent methyltransferase [Chloroflexota bacterium]